MKFLKKLFAPKEVKTAIGVIDEFEYSCNTSAFRFVVRLVPDLNRWVDPFSLVREVVESTILEQSEKFISVIKEQGMTPRQKVYSMMEHVAGDYLESGSLDFFVYRGVLNFCGEELLRIYDLIIDRMREIDCVSDEEAKKQKSDIRHSIERAC